MLKSRTQAKSVLVNLDALFGSAGTPAVPGLELHGWARGALHEWLRCSDGQWVGVVTYLISWNDDTIFHAERQLVPAGAMRQE